MDNPTLLVIAGCNGAGKSSFSKALVPEKATAYDYDKVYLAKYNALIDFELRDVMAHNLSRKDFEDEVEKAIDMRKSFCYETNFHSTPLYWPEKFKQNDYRLELAFFCLDSTDNAKERVQIRVENGGHIVPGYEIESRFKLGYKHLNKYWKFFDSIHLFNTSTYNQAPEHILTLANKSLVKSQELPDFLPKRIPSIISEIEGLSI